MPTSHSTVYGDRLALVCGWIGVAAIVLGAWTSSAGAVRPRRPLPEGVSSPILALELIRTPSALSDIAPTEGEQQQLAKSIRIDYAFVAGYALLFAAIGLFSWTSVGTFGRRTAVVVVVAGLGAALFDVLENREMLALLNHRVDASPRIFSLWKWRLLFLTVLASAPVFIDRSAPTFRRLVGYLGVIVAVAASVEGSIGAWVTTETGIVGNDKLIEAAARRVSTMLLIAVFFLLTRRALREGVLKALDRLAELRMFAWMVEWPSRDRDEPIGDPLIDQDQRLLTRGPGPA